MPTTSSSLDPGWLAGGLLPAVSVPDRALVGTSALAASVAAIVAVAAQRALAAGDLPGLRALVERALNAVEPPFGEEREEPDLPPIADAEPEAEGLRLLALMRRQRR